MAEGIERWPFIPRVSGSILSAGNLRKFMDSFGHECCSTPETLAETVESDSLWITDLFQNKSVAFFPFIIRFL